MKARDLYLDLLRRSLMDAIYGDPDDGPSRNVRNVAREKWIGGLMWPSVSHSMVGVYRLKSLQDLTQTVLDENVPGDFIETGVWRGGCCILMRGVLAANEVTDRKVYVADSFEGLPPPKPDYPRDAALTLHKVELLRVSQDQVARNFSKYGLLDDQVVFVKGFFNESLPKLDAGPFALIRLDGDMYESTIVALDALYPKLSAGGVLVVDDYGIAPCRQAVTDYREKHGITSQIHRIKHDRTGVWWRK